MKINFAVSYRDFLSLTTTSSKTIASIVCVLLYTLPQISNAQLINQQKVVNDKAGKFSAFIDLGASFVGNIDIDSSFSLDVSANYHPEEAPKEYEYCRLEEAPNICPISC